MALRAALPPLLQLAPRCAAPDVPRRGTAADPRNDVGASAGKHTAAPRRRAAGGRHTAAGGVPREELLAGPDELVVGL